MFVITSLVLTIIETVVSMSHNNNDIHDKTDGAGDSFKQVGGAGSMLLYILCVGM